MDLDPVLLSRIQFAFVVSFHIIFPAFTIGLAAWLAVLEAAHLGSGREIYRRIFEFWMKVFAVSFGMGVVTGIVMAFQFGTNWGVLAEKMGSIQGPLLGYEGFTAFMLEATFFGVMLLGRDRVSPRFYLFACCMVALGTMFSSFWIMANNSWMQVPVGHTVVDGRVVPSDWWAIVAGPVMAVRWPHMLLGAFLTTGMCIIATGAWYLLRHVHRAEGQLMLDWGLGLVAVLIPVQLWVGHLTGDYVHRHQPAKFAAIEARWHTEQPAREVLIAWPDEAQERNLLALSVPRLGSFIASGTWDSRELGLTDFPQADRPPVLIPFFAFRLMVGMGLVMLAIAWGGLLLRWSQAPIRPWPPLASLVVLADLLLAVLRLAWRRRHAPPPWPPAMPAKMVDEIMKPGSIGSMVHAPLRPRSWRRFVCNAKLTQPIKKSGGSRTRPTTDIACNMPAPFLGTSVGMNIAPSSSNNIMPPKPAMRLPVQN